MQYNTRKTLINIIFVFLVLLGITGSWFLFYTNSVIQNSQTYVSYIFDIRRLNDEIDTRMGENTTIVNFDAVNRKLNEMTDKLNAVANYPGFYDFFLIRSNRAIFRNFEKAILAKKAMLEEYKTRKSQAIESTINLASNLRHTKEVRTMAGFFTRLILSRFGDALDSEDFDKEVAALHARLAVSETHASVDYNYIGKLMGLNQDLVDLASIEEKNNQLNISAKAIRLIDALNSYIHRNFLILGFGIFVLGLILVLFFARIVSDYVKTIKLRKYARQMDDILEFSNNSLITVDSKGLVIKASEYFKASNNNFLNKPLEFLDEMGERIDIIGNLLESRSIQKYDFAMRKKSDGELVYEKIMATPNFDKSGKLVDADIILQDFSKEYIINERLGRAGFEQKKAATIDKETGFSNHLALTEQLALREHAHVLYISIDQFSNIVFFYNQATVLLILIEIGKTINLCLENNRINAHLYHLQEDKFCVYYQDNRLEADVKHLLSYFTPNIIISDDSGHDISIDLDITIGVSLNVDTINTDRLTQARLAHQKARRNEENLAYYQQNDDSEKIYRQNQYISRLIRYALNTNKITTECQPIFDLQLSNNETNSYQIHSYEILVRMLDEQNKMHYPGEFLGVAKQAGLYLSITRAVINRAFELINRFNYRFSINLSSSDMSNTSVRELMLKKLDECEHPQNVTIEVLETEEIEGSFEEVYGFLKQVRERGCRVAIDDFGSGYANLAMLLELNVDYIKLDGSIVRRLPYDEDAVNLISALANFANNEGYTMVAEFVSDQAILDVVKHLGVRYAQGYLLGRPRMLA